MESMGSKGGRRRERRRIALAAAVAVALLRSKRQSGS
jgi:hypothetical protein